MPRFAATIFMLAVGASGPCAADSETNDAGDPPAGMVAIAAGEFTMGRTFETSDDKSGMRPLILRDDRPAHVVRLDAYWMDATEVTQSAYGEFLAATGREAPYHWPGGEMPDGLEDYPIFNVGWDDAAAFCAWKGKRLPTEAEWERAARGGLEGKNYPWGEEKPDRRRARYSTPDGAAPVGRHAPNGFGLFDMAGGVSEWCHDRFGRTYYAASPPANPRGPSEGEYRIFRGGSWSDGPNRITVFFRNWTRPGQRTPNLGFRCVQDAR